jgi:hypothetical protein
MAFDEFDVISEVAEFAPARVVEGSYYSAFEREHGATLAGVVTKGH